VTKEAPIRARPHYGTTPEQARAFRARAWRFIFDCHEKKGGPETAPNAGKETNERSGKTSIPR